MRISIEWLRDYVDWEDSPENLADRLTFSGLEVEGLAPFGPDLSGLVAAEVRSVSPHPGADRLRVCRVDDGRGERQVVCGAPNVREGGRYPFAPPGSVLPDGSRIEATPVRGVVSEGMLCSEAELGLGGDDSGLMPLPEPAPPGTPLARLLGGADTVLDLEVTPNRPDCLSLLGIAREVAALYGVRMRRPAPDAPACEGRTEALVSVRVEEPALCPRYLARVLSVAAPAPSPWWLRRRLLAAGIRSLHPAVDVTNYVLLECGHPLHAFDRDRLEGAQIVVRRARAGERLRTLDGADRELAPGALVIADASRPVALAGILGGADSEISAGTRSLLLESACFEPGGIRRTARRMGLHTESSHRFARGTDPEAAGWASRRAVALMHSVAGAVPAEGELDLRSAPGRPVTVFARWSSFSRALGEPAAPDGIAAVLEALELEPAGRDEDGARWRIPSFRLDLRGEADLIEEYARIRGFDRIAERSPRALHLPGTDDPALLAEPGWRNRLAALGLTEILNHSMTSERLLDRFDPGGRDARVRLPHPLSEDQGVLRTSLLPQMVETLGRNRSRQVEAAACFETGRVFHAEEGGIRETARVALGLMGAAGEPRRGPGAAASPERRLQWLRGILASWLAAEGVDDWSATACDAAPFEPGRALRLEIGGRAAGRMGLLAPEATADWRIAEPLALAELDLAPLLLASRGRRPPRPPPGVPFVRRDLAFTVDKAVRHEEILSAVRRAAAPELERVELFDLYEGPGIGPGRKSMAYSFAWRAAGRTLTDDEVAGYDQAVREALARECGAEIRDRRGDGGPAPGPEKV